MQFFSYLRVVTRADDGAEIQCKAENEVNSKASDIQGLSQIETLSVFCKIIHLFIVNYYLNIRDYT